MTGQPHQLPYLDIKSKNFIKSNITNWDIFILILLHENSNTNKKEQGGSDGLNNNSQQDAKLS